MNKYVTLKSKKDFDKIFKSKNTTVIQNDNFIYKYIKNDQNLLRFAISPPKKIFRKAVVRVKIKRQVRTFIQKLSGYKSIDAIIIIKEHYLMNKYSDNATSFVELYKKI